MIDTIKDLFRRRKLKKHASDVPTGFLPMSEIYTVNVMIDVEEPGFDALREDILAWGRSIKAKVNIYFFDFRRLGKEELLLTSIQTTILRKELDWTDAPDVKKVANLLEEQSDLFISMIDNGDFPIEFLSKCAKARFKIGRKGFEGHAYDMVVTGGETAELRSDSRKIFAAIKDFLTKIQ
jgi:hypothetical protein